MSKDAELEKTKLSSYRDKVSASRVRKNVKNERGGCIFIHCQLPL